MTVPARKKLIEVSLPLEVINAEASREKSIRHGHPSTLHLYWARRPLAAARAVLFAQLVDDPSSRPEQFPSELEQDVERARLHRLMEKLVMWKTSNDERLFREAAEEIRKSNGGELPAVLDPFAGGGAIPLEAQRLGLEAHASDLNPLAVLINKAMIEIPPRFASQPPIYPGLEDSRSRWDRAEGLAEDIRAYGDWMRDLAFEKIGHLYPKVEVPGEGEKTVIAWIWARTVINPNPANPIEVPLVRSWWLSKKKGQEAWIHASVVDGQVKYEVRYDAEGPEGSDDGTVTRKGAVSIADGTPISFAYIREEGRAGRMGAQLMAIVAEGNRSRSYVSANDLHIGAADLERPNGVPVGEIFDWPGRINVFRYGMTEWADLFTNRQLVALTTLSDSIEVVRDKVRDDALAAGIEGGARLEDGGRGAEAYADAVATYLAFGLSRMTDISNSLCRWEITKTQVRNLFGRQAIPMVWDFSETMPFGTAAGGYTVSLGSLVKALIRLPAEGKVNVVQADAAGRTYDGMVISTDPPYYDNIGYSDLSDFFYVWLRRSLSGIHSKTVGTMLTPKDEELVANPYRHEGREGAEKFFIDGFNNVFEKIRREANLAVPMTVYYAYKQQEEKGDGTSSTGWHTLLDGLIDGGWEITATWPMRTETSNRLIASGSNALASSIVLACRPRPEDAPATTRRALVSTLKRELPGALQALMKGAIAPVDLAQAAIGPGISVFSRYSRVTEADGSTMSVKEALQLINATLDEVLGEQESDFDPDTRFAVKWYRQYGWGQESSGIADQLARSSDTSIGGLQRGGIFEARGGRARLLAPSELSSTWDVDSDDRVSVWEATVRLAAIMSQEGAEKVSSLLPDVQEKVSLDAVKELGFLLFHEAEKNRDTQDAILFNGLISAWGDITAQARRVAVAPRLQQGTLDLDFGEV